MRVYLLVVHVVQEGGGELLQYLVQALVQTPPDVARHPAPAPPREPAPPAPVNRDEGGVHWGGVHKVRRRCCNTKLNVCNRSNKLRVRVYKIFKN